MSGLAHGRELMRIAILANDKNSFVKPLADGLARMAAGCGAEPEIHYDGIAMLSLPLKMSWASPRSAAGHAIRLRRHRKLFRDFVERVRGADLIVVVAHVPASLARNSLQNIETLRSAIPDRPIVNYDLVYLPTVVKWSGAMLRGEDTGLTDADRRAFKSGAFGLERYDWYLVASATSEIAMPAGPQPCSIIGVNLDDGTLYPDQTGEFRVLVDFEQTRKDYLSFREVQLAALDRSEIPYHVLDKPLSRDEIREVYRKTGAFMMAHRESFGLPICELQACGSLIFTPRSEWAGAHWIKPDLHVSGSGAHSGNFIVYQNDLESLVKRLRAARENFNPSAVREQFLAMQPQLFEGDRSTLANFLQMVDEGAIHSRRHEQHTAIGR